MAATDAGDDADPVVLLVRLLSEMHDQWLASPPPRVEVAIGEIRRLLRMAQMLADCTACEPASDVKHDGIG